MGLLPAPCLGSNPEPWVQGQGVAEGMGAHWQCMLFACKSREVQLAVVLALVDPPVDLCWMCGVLCCLHMHMRTCMMPHLPLTHYILRGSRHSDHIGHWHWQYSCHTIVIVWVLRLQLLPGCAHAKTKAPANSWDTLVAGTPYTSVKVLVAWSNCYTSSRHWQEGNHPLCSGCWALGVTWPGKDCVQEFVCVPCHLDGKCFVAAICMGYQLLY